MELQPLCKNREELEVGEERYQATLVGHKCLDHEDKNKEHVNTDNIAVGSNTNTKQILKCDLCSYNTSLERRLTLHMDKVHPEQIFEPVTESHPLPYKCYECEYSTAIESYLVDHKNMLHDIVEAKCGKCDFEANIQAEMICHKLMVHSETNPYKSGITSPQDINIIKWRGGRKQLGHEDGLDENSETEHFKSGKRHGARKNKKCAGLDENAFNDIDEAEHKVELVDDIFETKRKGPGLLGKRKKMNMKEQWHKGCEYQCKMCNDTRDSVGDIRKHVKRFHPSMEHTDSSNYNMTREEFFDCVLCDENMHRDYLVIKMHVRSKHKMGMVEYARDHVDHIHMQDPLH